MEGDLNELLKANLAISRENNQILRKMRSAQKWAQITRVVYYVIIAGATVGAFYYIQPFIAKFSSLIPGLDKLLSNLPDLSKLNSLLPR